MDNQNTHYTSGQDEQNPLLMKDFIMMCLAKWYWFVIAVVVCVSIAALHVRRTPPRYVRSAKVLIKSERRGSSAANLSDFTNMGLMSMNSKVTNEVNTFASNALMSEVVSRLGLETTFYTDGSGHKVLLYSSSLPISLGTDSLNTIDGARFTISTDGVNAIVLKDFYFKKDKIKGFSAKGVLGDTLATPFGKICVLPSDYYRGELPENIYVSHGSHAAVTTRFSGKLGVDHDTKDMSDVITLNFQDINIQRAEDVLNTLIAVYNESWIKDKNQIAKSTSMFIDDRLRVIERELADVDSDISSYKSEQLIPDVGSAASLYMKRNSDLDSRQQELTIQLGMAKYIRNYLAGETDSSKLLPANTGVDNVGIEKLISEYNQKVLRRNSLAANSSTSNPLVVENDEQLSEMRRSILGSIDNLIVSLEAQISGLENAEKKNTSKIAATPTQARHLLSVERQQTVKEALYLYLLQKREENELNQAFTAYNTRVIDPPTGPMNPVAPSKSKILLLALLIGLAIPVGLIYLILSLNTTVRGRNDLKDLSIPFLGEIPLAVDDNKNVIPEVVIKVGRKMLRKKTPDAHNIVVERGNRDIINEAFRVLRTNLEFITQESKGNVVAITSFNPGSGKSFITANLAVVLAVKGKRVLLVDGDLRHASLSQYMQKVSKGFADYLAHRIDDVSSILQTSEKYDLIDFLPVGTIPPNPTELVSDSRFLETINALKGNYDYVLIDCPPIEIVADTQIIEQSCDRTIFIARAGLLERSMLPELESIYKQKKFKNMAVVLNGTTTASGHYSYRYGYKYGYKYGYHHGYGYYGSKADK
ncbi:MAG: polysaccharide biosynthesis tyrosine autokinase [Bacteroidales bacterium]|nr:polysaccharide biosynthesis tyrosine autokinase [Bacteroidales bacterium]